MDRLGFIRVAACSPEVRIGQPMENASNIIDEINKLEKEGVGIAVFPELGITGYTCGDLFEQYALLEESDKAIRRIAEETRDCGMTVIVGAPVRSAANLYNCAVVISDGCVKGIVPKTFIPNYGEFYERRWFNPADTRMSISAGKYGNDVEISTGRLFESHGVRFGIEICEDLWVPTPPSNELSLKGADLIFNLSATDEVTGKHQYLLDLIRNQSARCRCGYVYASAGTGESSTDMAFAGNCIIAEDGKILAESERFSIGNKRVIADIDVTALRHDRRKTSTFADNAKAYASLDDTAAKNITCGNNVCQNQNDPELLRYRYVDSTPFVDKDISRLSDRCEEISSIQAWGLATRLKAIGCRNTVIGISGGLDSTLALLVTVKAFRMLGLDLKGITAVTMPGFGTTTRTHTNADRLMDLLGVTKREIPIGAAVSQHFRDIGHDSRIHDITYENSQARERTQILMDIANQTNGLVIGTGDLSELALGWCTYNGDQMSMYGVNASVPKTLVRYLVEGFAKRTDNRELREVLLDIADTPISPELLPANPDDSIDQKTEDLVGPYELHDFFIYRMLRYGDAPEKIFRLALKAFEGKYDPETIHHWLDTFLRRFFNQQFKRSCMPDGVKVGSVCLSPRGDWRMPSDMSSATWRDRLEKEWKRWKEKHAVNV